MKNIKKIEKILTGLLGLLGVEGSVESLDEDGVLRFSILTPSPALVIGYHGKTLEALSMIASAIAYRKLGEGVRVVVDAGDWRVKREEKLVTLSQNVASRVKELGREEPIYNLTPAERKIVHTALGEVEGVISESRGEGRDRYLVVKPKGIVSEQ